jgi:hypothetical protein
MSDVSTTDDPMTRMDGRPLWFMDRGVGHHPQIVGDHPPADPAFHTAWAMISAAIQLMAPCQPTDPPLEARAPVMAAPTPPWLLMRQSCGRLGSRLGQDHRRDPVCGGISLMRRGVDPAGPREQAGRALDYPQLMVQTPRQLRGLSWMTPQDSRATDDPALALVQPEAAANRRRLPGFAGTENRGMRFEQAHPVCRRWDGFALDHPPGRVGDYLADPRDDVVPGPGQFLTHLPRLGLAHRPRPVRLPHRRRREGAPVSLGGQPPVSGRRAALPRRRHQPFQVTRGTARTLPQDLARQGGRRLQHGRGFGQRAAQHLHASIAQRAVGGGMDGGFHDRPVEPPLATRRDLARARQPNDVVAHAVQGGRFEQIGPAAQGRSLRHGFHRDPTALAPHQTVADPGLGGLVAPPIQVFNPQHPQDDLDRGRRASVNRGPRKASAQVGFHRLEQRVVVEQGSQLGPHGVQREAQGRDEVQQLQGLIAITQHTISALPEPP